MTAKQYDKPLSSPVQSTVNREGPGISFQDFSIINFKMADKIVRAVIRLGIGGLLVINASGELFPHQACKEINGLKDERGVFVNVPERCYEEFKEVATKFGVKNTEKVTLFVNQAFHAVSAGSTSLPGGAVIGLPRWYLYETKKDVENSGLKFNEKDIEWNSELGVTMTESYIPTDNMIAFTLGHELSHIQRLDFKLFETCASPLWLYLTYRICNSSPRILKLQAIVNVLLKLSICGISYFSYNFFKQKVHHLSEFTADEMSSLCDPRMAQGGVEFFTRRLRLNLIQRRLLGLEGEKFYSEEGDELKSYSHPQLTVRLEKVNSVVEKTSDVLDSS